MGSTHRKIQRRQEIAVIREHARIAFREGKSISTCPYKNDMNEFQWVNEYLFQKYLVGDHIMKERPRYHITIDDIEAFFD